MPELLSPAGNLEKLKSAVLYGANAVYLAGERFGMRAAADNFSPEELYCAIQFAHQHGVKVYAAVNVMPRTSEYPALNEHIRIMADAGVDAFIVSDMGVLEVCRRTAPSVEIHISTQASIVSADSCIAWARLGAKRIVLARELTLDEISEIKQNIPRDIELECFIHGSMCIAYSGRCLLSQYYLGRDANRGMCAQPCRWEYNASPIYSGDRRPIFFAEEKRPQDMLSIEEERGESFIMSSRDLSMIEHIPQLYAAGIDSFKIEGRMKSAYYTAVVTNAYRMAMDSYERSPSDYSVDPLWLRELESVSHREYATGFFFTPPGSDAKTVSSPGYIREKAYLATAIHDCPAGEWASFSQKNKLSAGENAELISPGKVGRALTIPSILDEKDSSIPSAPHPGMIFKIKAPFDIKAGDILRKGD